MKLELQKFNKFGISPNGLFKDDKFITGESYEEILRILQTDTKFNRIRFIKSITENISEKDKNKFIKEGQFPRVTENYYRFRQIDPSKFDEETFRTKKEKNGNARIIGKINGKWEVQSILINKKNLEESDLETIKKMLS